MRRRYYSSIIAHQNPPATNRTIPVNEDLKVRIEKAESLMQQGHLPSAHFALKKILRKDPDNVHALVLSAEHRFRDRKQTESVDLINKLFDMEPEHFGGELQKRLGHRCF